MPEKKRYLKGKDGKFSGSIPGAPKLPKSAASLPTIPGSPLSVTRGGKNPTSPEAASIPSASSQNLSNSLDNAYRAMAAAIEERRPKFHEMKTHEERIERLIEFRNAEPNPELISFKSVPEVLISTEMSEPGYATVYGSRQHKTYSAVAKLNEETNKFEATVINSVFNHSNELATDTFDSEDEAKQFAKENLAHHLQIVDKFRNAMNNNRSTLLATLESELISDGYLKLAPLEEEGKFLAIASGKLPIRDCEFKFDFGRGLNSSVIVSKKNPDGTTSKYDYAAKDIERVALFALFIAYHK